jgi:alpha-amylase/alpha-mannosidase (GH57 family)
MPVVLCWHMHQPEYRDLDTGAFRLPWTLLHALKDYVDMAAHLERVPAARAVVNFAPVLLEQVADLAGRTARLRAHGTPTGEPLLDALGGRLPEGSAARAALVRQCLRANEARVIARFPAYSRLVGLAKPLLEDAELDWLSDRYLLDLVVWYLLAWTGESVRRADPRVQRLEQRARGFDAGDRGALLALVHESLAGLFARYRALAASGRVELSMSPYAHPILPLLLDPRAGQEALPDSEAPRIADYPGGLERARWQLRTGRDVFRAHFGMEPAGCWPSEGALSTATVRLLAEEGFRWCASGEGVLRNSLAASGQDAPAQADPCVHRVYHVAGQPTACFFRDDGLSDLIGFSYASWHADDAVGNLLHHMENIAAACRERRDCAIVVILDGENAWEHYPENAWHFMEALYARLGAHPRLRPTTFSEFLGRNRPVPVELPRLVAGSWVYGTLSTWVGAAEKNRAWELLAAAKQAFDVAIAAGRLEPEARAAAECALAVCEGSDWFWWFGDYNPAQTVSDFERQYRAHLASLYRLIGEPAPAALSQPLAQGHGDPALGGVMRPGSAG